MKNDDSKNILAILAIPTMLALLILIALLFGLFYAWAAQQLYEWFIRAPFHAPYLNVWNIYGIVILLNVIRPPEVETYKGKGIGHVLKQIPARIFAVLVVLLIGFIVKNFI